MVLDTTMGTDGMPGARLYGGGMNWHIFDGNGIYEAILTDEHE